VLPTFQQYYDARRNRCRYGDQHRQGDSLLAARYSKSKPLKLMSLRFRYTDWDASLRASNKSSPIGIH